MKDLNVVHYVASNLWAMLPSKMHELLSVLARHAAGHYLTPEEIRARLGDDPPERAEASQKGAVAVVPLRGVIAHRMGSMDEMSGGTSVERFQVMFRAALNSEGIAAILLDVDSPGGTIPGVMEMAAEVLAARGKKPIIAHANSIMASAAYWLASAADQIVATPSGLVGSIGVFTVHEDLSKLLEQEGVKVSLISAGKFKTEGNPFEPLTDEGRAFLQGRVDEAYDQFVKAVAKGRSVAPTDVRKGFGEGRALPAKDALAAGLIDKIGTFDETVARLLPRKSSGARAELSEWALRLR